MNLLRKALHMKAAILIVALAVARPVFAGPYSDALGKRLVESTTSEDRVLLIRWMFALMSLHPEIKDLTTVTPQQRTELNREAAKMFEDLITVRCAKEAREAIRYEGMQAIQASFQLLGQVAARGLFDDPQVKTGAAEMDKYLDKEKFKKLMQEEDSAPGK